MKTDLIRKLADYLSPYSEDYAVSSAGARITLVRNKGSGERAVLYNGFTYSRLPEKTLFTRSYWDYFLPFGNISGNARLLMIGLGGGTIAYQMERLFPNADMDIVEIDADMANVARKFYPKMRSNVIIDDGVKFVRSVQNAYDGIILDAYSDLDIPRQFVSDQFIGDAFNALNDTGVLGINYAQTSLRAEQLRDYSERLGRLFSVYHVRMRLMSDNTVLLCGKGMAKEKLVNLAKGMPMARNSRHILEGYKRMSAFK